MRKGLSGLCILSAMIVPVFSVTSAYGKDEAKKTRISVVHGLSGKEGSSWVPYVIREKGNDKVQGIFSGIMVNASLKFGYDYTFHNFGDIPATEMRKNIADEREKILCEGPASETWIPDEAKKDILLSTTIMESRDLIFQSGKSSKKMATKEDLKGAKLVGCAGYRYPTLENQKDFTLILEDIPSSGLPCGYQTVLDGKADGFLFNEHSVGYSIKKGLIPSATTVKPSGFVVESFGLKILCSKTDATRVFFEKLNAIIEKMHKDGTIRGIVKKYVHSFE